MLSVLAWIGTVQAQEEAVKPLAGGSLLIAGGSTAADEVAHGFVTGIQDPQGAERQLRWPLIDN